MPPEPHAAGTGPRALWSGLRRGRLSGDVILVALATFACLVLAPPAFWAGLVLAVGGWGNWAASPLDDRAFVTRRAIELHGAETSSRTVMILGNSMTLGAIGDPAPLSALLEDASGRAVSVALLASPAQSLAEAAALVETARPAPGSLVMLGVSELLLVDMPGDGRSAYRLGLPRSSVLAPCEGAGCGADPAQFYLRRWKSLLSRDVPVRRFGYPCEDGAVPSCRTPAHEGADALLAERLARAEPDPRFAGDLLAFTRAIRGRYGVEVALFLEPLNHDFVARIGDDAPLARARAAIDALAREAGAVLIESPGRAARDSASFMDFGHVADEALRRRVARAIADALVPAARDAPGPAASLDPAEAG